MEDEQSDYVQLQLKFIDKPDEDKTEQIDIPKDSYFFFPERLRSMSHNTQKQLNQIELLFMDEFVKISLKQKLLNVIDTIRQSSYHDFFYYSVLDKAINWTSLLGISQDGICLLDAEVNVGYLYLPLSVVRLDCY